MTNGWWCGNIPLTDEEKNYILQNNVYGINSGNLGFKSQVVNILKDIDNFLNLNIENINYGLEQPALNIYLFRNKLYNNNLNDVITNYGYRDSNNESNKYCLIHYAGGPGNYDGKYPKMLNFYNYKGFENGNINSKC